MQIKKLPLGDTSIMIYIQCIYSYNLIYLMQNKKVIIPSNKLTKLDLPTKSRKKCVSQHLRKYHSSKWIGTDDYNLKINNARDSPSRRTETNTQTKIIFEQLEGLKKQLEQNSQSQRKSYSRKSVPWQNPFSDSEEI